ncbi:PilZ domain-containing protein [Dactylosporangium sp. CA-092794]|uniref:PilZ domain-containing protein n=1 Tax=Dactylosporangium sp. CA-092794 TaxID=3239929 RepID=UPI003D9036ED
MNDSGKDGLPAINTLVDVVLMDGEAYQSRVEDADGKRLTVAAPFGVNSADVPEVGSIMELAWVAGDRRHAVDVRLAELTRERPPRWSLEAVGSIRLQTRRNYVRGGGGEEVEVTLGGVAYQGKVVDLSEGGVRCRMEDDRFDRDDRVDVRVQLDTGALALRGIVLFVRRDHENATYDVIITYETNEIMGRAIRGYVLRREMEERRRNRESVANAG